MRQLVIAGAVFLTVACSSGTPDDDSGGTWVGTITTDGNVTTVVNESGSVWGGPATLVEEASIGVDSGPEEYLLDEGAILFATDDVIFVGQPSVPVVRRYAFDGTFLGNLGRPGQGPGEYGTPLYIAANEAGRTFVFDDQGKRINVYGHGGNAVDTWTLPDLACCLWPLALSSTGDLRAPVLSWEDATGPDSPRYGAQTLNDNGEQGPILWVPHIDYERRTVSVFGEDWQMVPFAPELDWAVTAEGLVAGASDRYRFEVLRHDGARMIVQRYWNAVPVDPAHADWKRASQIRQIREQAPGWTWTGDEMPTHQPAYDQLVPTASGETWVLRSGESERVRDCTEDDLEDARLAYWRPCWRGRPIIDVFGADGRYLGEVALPDGLTPRRQTIFVHGTLVVAPVEDDSGTILVKRYRLVVPREES